MGSLHTVTSSTDATLFSCAGSEPQQPPLYYLLAAGWQKALGLPPQAPYQGHTNIAIFLEPHRPALTNDHTANHGFVMWLRYLSIAMGVFTIIISYLAVRLVTRDPWTPVVAAGILAFIPRFIFLTAFVTNDALVVLLGATLMYASLRFTLSPSLARMVPLGAVFGLLVLTKLSALPMGLVIASAALLVAGWRRRLGLAALGAGVALVVSGWYLIQNTVRYGDPLAFRATKRYQTRINGLGNFNGQPYVVHDPLKYVFVKVPQQLVHSLWFQSGWGQFVWPSWVNLGGHLRCFSSNRESVLEPS